VLYFGSSASCCVGHNVSVDIYDVRFRIRCCQYVVTVVYCFFFLLPFFVALFCHLMAIKVRRVSMKEPRAIEVSDNGNSELTAESNEGALEKMSLQKTPSDGADVTWRVVRSRHRHRRLGKRGLQQSTTTEAVQYYSLTRPNSSCAK